MENNVLENISEEIKTTEVLEELIKKRDERIEVCGKELIKERFKEDCTDWSKERIQRFLRSHNHEFIWSTSDAGAVYIGLKNKDIKQVTSGYEIFLDFSTNEEGQMVCIIRSEPLIKVERKNKSKKKKINE